MINELFLYDRDKGLFKEILKQSKTIKGNYHVAPHYGHELNSANLEAFLKDPASGLAATKQYPICICLTPVSRFISINGQKWEEFIFTLYFLCRANVTGNNNIKKLDRDTNTSAQHTWLDWSDMKQCAGDFLEILNQTYRKQSAGEIPLRTLMNVEMERAQILRLTKYNNDELNGAGLTFVAHLYTKGCQLKDYSTENEITIPNLT